MTVDRATLELNFGRVNIIKWSDIDNDRDEATIQARIDHAIVWARAHLESLTVGLTLPDSLVVDDIISRFAGIWLYESRGITEQDATTSPVAHHRKFCYNWVALFKKSSVGFSIPTAPSVI